MTTQPLIPGSLQNFEPGSGETARLLERVHHFIQGVHREVWLVGMLLALALITSTLIRSNEMVLGVFILPTIFSAYFFGRRHATLTAFASVLLVIQVTGPGGISRSLSDPALFLWLRICVWGGTLMLTGYAMGSLYERLKTRVSELRQTYYGILMILQQFISNDKYTHNHSYRVSVYAVQIAQRMRFGDDAVEDVRAAALLHDIGKLDISRDILYKAARLTGDEYKEVQGHVEKGVSMLEPGGGSLNRIIPIILAHHDQFDGTGYHPHKGTQIPLAARVIILADVYDAVTSDRPYRKAMSPFDAKEMIAKGAGRDFDLDVVRAFVAAFRAGEMEVP